MYCGSPSPVDAFLQLGVRIAATTIDRSGITRVFTDTGELADWTSVG
jgi:hypothetical protein